MKGRNAKEQDEDDGRKYNDRKYTNKHSKLLCNLDLNLNGVIAPTARQLRHREIMILAVANQV